MTREEARADGVEAFVVVAGPKQSRMRVDSVWQSPAQAKARCEMLRGVKVWFYVGPANDYQAAHALWEGLTIGGRVDHGAPEILCCPVAHALTACPECGWYPLKEGDERCDRCISELEATRRQAAFRERRAVIALLRDPYAVNRVVRPRGEPRVTLELTDLMWPSEQGIVVNVRGYLDGERCPEWDRLAMPLSEMEVET